MPSAIRRLASGLIARLAARTARLSLPACRIVLDRLVFDTSGAARRQRADRGLASARRRLRDGQACRRARFSPHVTLHYDHGSRGATWIDPISWRATELVLIESVSAGTFTDPRPLAAQASCSAFTAAMKPAIRNSAATP